jgi:hypothetical protein
MSDDTDVATAAMARPQLHADLAAMVGVWRDHLVAFDLHGAAVDHDPHGGVPGPFPYDNLVYVDFDEPSGTYRQTNVTLPVERQLAVRTFEASVTDGVLRFARLGPDAPEHVGVSGGPGLIWFVSQRNTDKGLQRYAEPDLIRIEGDRRWRHTVLWRNGELVRTMLVEGDRLTGDTSGLHPLDPRPAGTAVHATRSVTTHYTPTTRTRWSRYRPRQR